MITKIGRLGQPRVAIALVWFLPANSSASAAPDGTPPEPEPIPPEEIEFVRSMTGMEPDELISRLRGIAEKFRDDPATMRRELVRLADGDEITAEEIMRIIRAAEPGNDNGHDDHEETTGEGAEILDFERPDDDGHPDDDGGEEP
jgi:DNA-binding transcriptional ArsR family regulator